MKTLRQLFLPLAALAMMVTANTALAQALSLIHI